MDPFHPYSCPSRLTGAFEQQFPVGMGYIPWQTWGQTYPLNTALRQGTFFPELDLQFDYRRCRR